MKHNKTLHQAEVEALNMVNDNDQNDGAARTHKTCDVLLTDQISLQILESLGGPVAELP